MGKGALLAASPLIAKPSPCCLIRGKETSKGEHICPRIPLGKPRANRACGLPTEREELGTRLGKGGWRKVMVLKAARCSVRRHCEGEAHPPLHVFFSFSLALFLCHVKSKTDLPFPGVS